MNVNAASGGPFDIFVVGLDDRDRAQLQRLPAARDRYRFHPLFSSEELRTKPNFPVRELLQEGGARLRAFTGRVDAVVGFWDFPVSSVLPLLRQSIDLPTTSLESVLRCEHKYWSRVIQSEVIPRHIPRFCAVNPFAADPEAELTLPFPLWIKPVKSMLSHLGFLVRDAAELHQSLERIRAGIGRYGTAFNEILRHARLPTEIAAVDGCHCVAESLISSGRQCTVEGYVYDGEVVIYGTIDSLREGPEGSCFARYQYPSTIPDAVQTRLAEISTRVMLHAEYDNAPFNIEFFWDESSDRISLLEINTRISRSHAPLFQRVDGVSHEQVMIELGLGHRPAFPHRRGEYACAGKFMLRRYSDAIVIRSPDPASIRALEATEAGVTIELHVERGMRLSELLEQDSYSYEVAALFIGARDEAELERRYQACLARLDLAFAPLPG
jgi:biotin carboxylase